ncbi:hypothetical protein CQW23_30155 [Capsicum baccatum]|uniref:UBN2 domain-containing protein n=1 Tax=Capsicum baccatum TaxID=33114 RepID=A0A2G2VB74_CAPBA|nr:hypothetical protein CQW23_30155 [Capsicum baccatum]
MRTILKSQNFWDLVEIEFVDPDEGDRLRNNKKKDAKVLVFIQQAVHDSIFSRIVAATTSKQAWSILQKEFQVAKIEESKDLSVFSFDELMESLYAHKARLNRSTENNEEKTFQVKDGTTKYGENNGPASRG